MRRDLWGNPGYDVLEMYALQMANATDAVAVPLDTVLSRVAECKFKHMQFQSGGSTSLHVVFHLDRRDQIFAGVYFECSATHFRCGVEAMKRSGISGAALWQDLSDETRKIPVKFKRHCFFACPCLVAKNAPADESSSGAGAGAGAAGDV